MPDNEKNEINQPRIPLTKDEMRAKIRASLAARQAEESTDSPTDSPTGQESAPETARDKQSEPVTRKIPAARLNDTVPDRELRQKTQRVREALDTQRAQEERQAERYNESQHAPEHYPESEPYRETRTRTNANTNNSNGRGRTIPQEERPRTRGAYESYKESYDPYTVRPQRNDTRGSRPMRREEQEQYDRYDTYRTGGGTSALKVTLIVVIILVVLIAAVYVCGMLLYRNKFLPDTTINGIDVSGMTLDQAEENIISGATEMGVTFIARDGTETSFKGSSFGFTTSIPDGALDEAWGESHAAWFVKFFSPSSYTVQLDQTYSEDALISLIAAYDWGNTPPTDAQIVENSDGSFSIQPEDDGNMVDTQILSDYAIEQVRQGNTTIYMEMSGCYMTASVTAESLEDTLSYYQKYAQVTITYDMTNREALFDPVGTELLDFHTFGNWITFSNDGTVTLDKDKATEWVQENIADKYDTFCSDGYTRSFQSTEDGTVDVYLTETSTYGWETDVDATVEELENLLQDGESVTTEPEWVQAGFRPTQSDGTVFEEGTYIEVDICHQHLWFYVDGELFMDTDVVTGLASDPDRQTHTGIFKIRDKQRDAILGTYEVQGYEQPVSFWMPIDHTGIGLHDLSRSAYGGDIYLTNGSHGCINLPYTAAETIYNEVVIGMPVVIID